MNTFKKLINEIKALHFIYENMIFSSPTGRKYMLNQKFLTNANVLSSEINNLSKVEEFIKKKENKDKLKKICNYLNQINDIQTTIDNLNKRKVLDDIELFEIKKQSITTKKLLAELKTCNFNFLHIKDTSILISILDPENTGISAFYIYSSYDEKLSELRQSYRQVQNTDNTVAEQIRFQIFEIEEKVREKLSRQLSKYSQQLNDNLNNIAYLDVLIAKANLAKKFNLNKAQIANNIIEYSGLFNPFIKDILQQQSKEFQSIDIILRKEPNLITGVNMGGKTVFLKTLALSQYMFQFGFFIPAQSAKLQVFDSILFNIGDEQSEQKGLSSFAVEMQNINEIITSVKKNNNVLVLIDELARTTNPEEGKAFVSAFVEIMKDYNVMSLITTHYSGINTTSRRLRIKGLSLENTQKITIKNINDLMDYSLIDVFDDNAPAQALKIAEILEVDNEYLNKIITLLPS